jgi:transcriptional regulator with XRE-family HTH domain
MDRIKHIQNDAKIIGINLKQLRELKHLTQGDLSEFLNVSYQQIQKYEAGKNRLPINSLYKLKHFFDIPFEYFFVGINNEPAKKQRWL